MEFVNDFHPALQYTWETSSSFVTFLDMNISINENHLQVHIDPLQTYGLAFLPHLLLITPKILQELYTLFTVT